MRKSIFTIFVTALLLVTLSSMHGGLLSRNKYEPCSENLYQGNMLMIAQVMEGDDVLLNYELAAFDSKEECRASEMSIPNDNGYVDLTIQGEGEGEPLHFSVVYESGDMIKNRDEFALFDGYEWTGSLTSMRPGMGYIYMSNDPQTKTFTYPSVSKSDNVRDESSPVYPWAGEYQNNMNVIAIVKNGDDVVENAVIEVFAADAIRGMSEQSIVDDKYFLTIYDVSGLKVYHSEEHYHSKQINVDFLNEGVYILKATTDDGSVIIRYVIKG